MVTVRIFPLVVSIARVLFPPTELYIAGGKFCEGVCMAPVCMVHVCVSRISMLSSKILPHFPPENTKYLSASTAMDGRKRFEPSLNVSSDGMALKLPAAKKKSTYELRKQTTA